LHLFSRNERWKEEILLTLEEMRRVGHWHLAKMRATAESVASTSAIIDWKDRGLRSLRVKLMNEAKTIYESLPHQITKNTLVCDVNLLDFV
jgi:hypothetical protein